MQKGFLSEVVVKNSQRRINLLDFKPFCESPSEQRWAHSAFWSKKAFSGFAFLILFITLLNTFPVVSLSPPKLPHPTAAPSLSLVHDLIKSKPNA